MGCNPGLERERSLPAQPAAPRVERLREERLSSDVVLPLIADRPPVTTGAKVAPQIPGEQPKAGPRVGTALSYQIEQYLPQQQQGPGSGDIAVRIAHPRQRSTLLELLLQPTAMVLNMGPEPRTKPLYAPVEFFPDGQHRHRAFGLWP